MNFIEKIGKIVSKNLTILVILVAVYCFFIPSTFQWVTPNMGRILSIMMFGVGMTIKRDQFKLVLERPRDVFIGAFCQFIIMPLVAFIISKIFNLSPELSLGLILVGTCPGGVSSNIMSFLAKGDVALSVSLTTMSTILAPILTPVITLILAKSYIEISIISMFISIIKTIIIPILLATLCSKLFPKINEFMNKLLPLLSSILLMMLVSGSISGSVESIKTSGIIMFLAVIIHHGIGFLLGYIIAGRCKMNENKKRVISLEVGMQNSGLATTLAFDHFTPVVSVAAALSGPLQTIFSAILANYWANKELNKDTDNINEDNIIEY